jgi:hypothetical protein
MALLVNERLGSHKRGQLRNRPNERDERRTSQSLGTQTFGNAERMEHDKPHPRRHTRNEDDHHGQHYKAEQHS